MNIFLDLGANMGQGLSEINNELNALDNDKFIVYSFEANPYINLKLDYKNFHYINKAVSTYNGKATFKVATRMNTINDLVFENNTKMKYMGASSKQGEYTSVGCYMIDNDIDGQLGGKGHHNVNVDVIDILSFMDDLIKKHKDVTFYIKMDIEGSEFKILRELLKNYNILKTIKKMWIETHERFVKNESEYTVDEIFNNLRKHKIEVVHWK